MTTEQPNKDVRDIDSFDTITNLQALIVDDLRKMGVKLPQRRDLSSMRAPPTEPQKVKHFKNYLGYVPCYYLEQFGHVPSFLVRAAAIIEQNIFVEGIFRKSGSMSRQKRVEEEVESECDVSSANLFDITSLIKQFFRELREPLLSHLYHDSFIKCLQLWTSSSSSSSDTASSEWPKADDCPVVKLCLLLPPEHLSTLRFTMNMFSKIAAASEHNKMNVRNLALIMAPSIMHNKGDKQVSGLEEKLLPLQMSLLELLISEEKNLGLVSAALYERAQTMTACFGNVLEPDNTATVKVAQSGGPKKRRSGSLQGFVSTIAQSLSRWHRNGISNSNSRSSLSRSSPDLSKVPPETSSSSSSSSFENKPPGVHLTPVILGKRKAPRDMAALGLSASKRKAAIIGQGPLLPNTPSSIKLTSRFKDVSNQYDLKSNMFTPNRIKTSPMKKPKRKPFFQALCSSSKNSKKLEGLKSLETKSKEPNTQEFGRSKEAEGKGQSQRRRKRSASPFRRFMKRKKSEIVIPPVSSPLRPETSNHRVRRSSTGSCYSPQPAEAVPVVSTGFVESWITSNHNPSKSVARVLQKEDNPSRLSSECLAGHKQTLLPSSVKEKTLPNDGNNGDSDESNDDRFSTISGGTVIFVADAEKTFGINNPLVFSACDRKITTDLNKYENLKSSKTDSSGQLHPCSQSVESRRTSLRSIQRNLATSGNGINNRAKKRSYSATDTKLQPPRPSAVASLKVTGETKKILQRAQVPDKFLIQPGSMMYCSSPIIADLKNFPPRTSGARTSPVKASSQKSQLKRGMPVGQTPSSARVCDQMSTTTPNQKSFSPAISKADVLLRHFNKQESEEAARNNNEMIAEVSSPRLTRNGQPRLYKNRSHVDCSSAPTPTKCPRLRRVSSPLSRYKTEEKTEGSKTCETPGNRRSTEYKQMIKAQLNSPNLYKEVLVENTSETCLRSPSVYKRRYRSLDGSSNSNVATIRQKFVLKELEKRQLHQKNINANPSSKKCLEPFTETQTIQIEKENSVFLSPAPILRYRKEQLPMGQINVQKDPSPRQVLQDCNNGSQPSSFLNGINTPICDIKNIHMKPTLAPPSLMKMKHQILDHKIHTTPIKAIHRPLGLRDSDI